MKMYMKSQVKGSVNNVFHAMDERLFRYLLPPGARLIRFDGSSPGHIVHLRLPPGLEWISEIIESKEGPDHAWFVDRGVKLPWPLRYWRHVHHVRQVDASASRIVDEMEYRTANLFSDLLIYPFLFLAFLPRTWQYKKYFRSLHKKTLSTQSHNSF